MRTTRTVIFHEYSGFRRSDGERSELVGELGLDGDSLRTLRSISDSVVPGKRVFDFGPDTIRARSLVGVLGGNDWQIEIHPKLLASESEDSESILKNLMFMLAYTHNLDVEDAGIASLSKDIGSFIEAYIAIFAERLARLIQRNGIPKRYEDRSDNLNKVRGKINFAKNSVVNLVNQANVYCDYSEFSEDNQISRAFKFVACSLEKHSKSLESRRKLQVCIGLLDGVQSTFVEPTVLDRSSFGRRDPNYRALIQLTKMFLSKLRPQFGSGTRNEVFALLFDMNELFERFVFELLSRHSYDLNIRVTAQTKKRLVSAERDFLLEDAWSPRNLFDTFTDITVTSLETGSKLIIDTKYKIVGEGAHYGIGNADAYQILAYKQIHSSAADTPMVGLLYPRFKQQLRREFKVTGEGPTFFAATIDLTRDFRTSLTDLVSELSQLLKASFSAQKEEDTGEAA